MKKLFVVLGLLLIATMLFVGCGKTDNSSTTQAQPLSQNNNITGTLQGKIMNALTGAPIGNDPNSELKVWLIQGTDNRTPSKLITDNNNDNVGEYAFNGIPTDINTGNATFKVVVVKAGFQRFEADVELTMDQTNFNELVDTVINMIGNIYLFPEGSLAGDVNIYVYDPSGLPIQGANVMVFQDIENNTSQAWDNVSTSNNNFQNGLNPQDDVLFPTGGLLTSMTLTTDANGLATISGANLVLGGGYEIATAEMVVNGVTLRQAFRFFEESTANPNQILHPTAFTSALFATSASNQVPGTITASGVLSITFNQPIILSTTTFGAVMSNSTATFITPSATGALSADGMTLTITPNFFAVPAATDAGATVTYSYGGAAFLKNTQTSVSVLSITNITTNAAVSPDVQMISN